MTSWSLTSRAYQFVTIFTRATSQTTLTPPDIEFKYLDFAYCNPQWIPRSEIVKEQNGLFHSFIEAPWDNAGITMDNQQQKIYISTNPLHENTSSHTCDRMILHNLLINNFKQQK